jgi:hypothetical protein
MENDIINLEEMCKILDKSPNTVRDYAKKKKIPARKVFDEWYSSKLALSMFVAGYNPEEIYEKIAEKVLKKSVELFI